MELCKNICRRNIYRHVEYKVVKGNCSYIVENPLRTAQTVKEIEEYELLDPKAVAEAAV